MITKALDTAIMEWYENTYNLKPLFAKSKPALTPETSLTTGKFPWARETGDEIMKDYFTRFNVDDSAFDFLAYWPPEKGLLPNILRPNAHKIANTEAKPLTIQMLIESARAGRWLF